MSHTPGPWELGKHGKYKQWIDGVNWNKLAAVYVCICGDNGESVPDAEGEANSRLIVASPDLANVAHMVLATATVYTPPELIKAAEAALQKAGEMKAAPLRSG